MRPISLLRFAAALALTGCCARTVAQSPLDWLMLLDLDEGDPAGSFLEDMAVDRSGTTYFIADDSPLTSTRWEMGAIDAEGDTLWLYHPITSAWATTTDLVIERDTSGHTLAIVGMCHSDTLFVGWEIVVDGPDTVLVPRDTIPWAPDHEAALMRFSSDTLLDWYVSLPGNNYSGDELLAILPDGSSYVAQTFRSNTALGPDTLFLPDFDDASAYLARISKDGEVLWTRTFTTGTDWNSYQSEIAWTLGADSLGRAHLMWRSGYSVPTMSVVDSSGVLLAERPMTWLSDRVGEFHVSKMITASNGVDHYFGYQSSAPFDYFLGYFDPIDSIGNAHLIDTGLTDGSVENWPVYLRSFALQEDQGLLLLGGYATHDLIPWQGDTMQDEFVILGYDTAAALQQTLLFGHQPEFGNNHWRQLISLVVRDSSIYFGGAFLNFTEPTLFDTIVIPASGSLYTMVGKWSIASPSGTIGMEESDSHHLSVFPVPFDDRCLVDLSHIAPYGTTCPDCSVEVFDLAGRRVFSTRANQGGRTEISALDIGAPGTYVVRCLAPDGSLWRSKIILSSTAGNQ